MHGGGAGSIEGGVEADWPQEAKGKRQDGAESGGKRLVLEIEA